MHHRYGGRCTAFVLIFSGILNACNAPALPAYAPEDSTAPLYEHSTPQPGAEAPSKPGTHFVVGAVRTGNNATIIIPVAAAPQIGYAALEEGDEIAVFTREGTCAGSVVWEGKNTALTLWGDNEMTPEIDGMQPDEPLLFRVWDASQQAEYHSANAEISVSFSSDKPYLQTQLRYFPNAIYVVKTFTTTPFSGEASQQAQEVTGTE